MCLDPIELHIVGLILTTVLGIAGCAAGIILAKLFWKGNRK